MNELFEENEIQLFQNSKAIFKNILNEIDSVDIFEIEDLNVTIENKKIISIFLILLVYHKSRLWLLAQPVVVNLL